jgi:hypothetical protein
MSKRIGCADIARFDPDNATTTCTPSWLCHLLPSNHCMTHSGNIQVPTNDTEQPGHSVAVMVMIPYSRPQRRTYILYMYVQVYSSSGQSLSRRLILIHSNTSTMAEIEFPSPLNHSPGGGSQLSRKEGFVDTVCRCSIPPPLNLAGS